MIFHLGPELLALGVIALLVPLPVIVRYLRRCRSNQVRPDPEIVIGARWYGTVIPLDRQPARAAQVQIGELRGRAHIIDGDTIVIKGTKIRLAGVDAPELDQPFGQKAKWALVEVCKGQVITAKLNGETSHDRLVGTCYLPDGRDIGAELIAQGLALDWAHFSGGKYRHLEPRGVRRKLRNKRTWR